MAASPVIKRWLDHGRKQKDITHLVVVCDTFDYEDYPVYVSKKESVEEIVAKYHGPNMQKVMEVYSYRRNLEKQMAETRAYHLD